MRANPKKRGPDQRAPVISRAIAHSGVTADAGDVVAQGDVDLGEHRRGRNRALDHKWAEIRGDKAVKRKAALTKAGGKYQEQLKRPWRTFRW